LAERQSSNTYRWRKQLIKAIRNELINSEKESYIGPEAIWNIFTRINKIRNDKILIFVNKQTESFATELSDHLDEKEFNIRISKTSSPWETGREYYYNNRFKKYNIVFNTIGASMTFWCFRERQRNGTKFITRETSSKIGDYITRIFAPNQMVFLTMHRRNKINKYTTVIPNAIDISTTKTTK